jgi:RecB family exonuclease
VLSTESAVSIRLSPSAIERYRRCEKLFYFSDVARVRVDEERSPALAQGNAIHHALERFFGLPLHERSVDNLHRALRAVWPQHRAGAFRNRDEEAFYGREALELLSHFAATSDLDVQPLAREQRVRFRLTPDVTLVGKIDRIDESADEEDSEYARSIEIVDYKTGRPLLEGADLPDEPATQVYVAAAEALFRRPVSKVRVIYLRGEEVTWVPGERDDVDELQQRLIKVCGQIAQTTDYQASPGRHCDWCRYALICEDRQRVEIDELVVPEGMAF